MLENAYCAFIMLGLLLACAPVRSSNLLQSSDFDVFHILLLQQRQHLGKYAPIVDEGHKLAMI